MVPAEARAPPLASVDCGVVGSTGAVRTAPAARCRTRGEQLLRWSHDAPTRSHPRGDDGWRCRRTASVAGTNASDVGGPHGANRTVSGQSHDSRHPLSASVVSLADDCDNIDLFIFLIIVVVVVIFVTVIVIAVVLLFLLLLLLIVVVIVIICKRIKINALGRGRKTLMVKGGSAGH